MKHITLALAIAFFPLSLFSVVTSIQPRSQSVDSSRDLIGLTRYINTYGHDCNNYGAWALTLEYTKTMHPGNIRENLFGANILNDKHPFIQISGSRVGDRDEQDWLADYFGLPTDFQSKISFEPWVDNIITDLAFYYGLEEWQEGLYFRVHAPLVYTRWNLNFNEEVIAGGNNGFEAGYFAPTAITRGQLLNNFTEFITGAKAPQLGTSVFFNPLEKAQFKNRNHRFRLSDVQAVLGWNFLQGDDHHLGLNLRVSLPAGNRPHGDYLFEPLVGNGHHWELGVGISTHVLLFLDECRPRTVAFYFDANITHMFETHQKRTFDLIGKPLSRYMLAQRMGKPVSNLFINTLPGTAAGSVSPTAQFQNLYTPLANLTTFDVNVSIAAQVDATAMFSIKWCNWDFDFGYNFWARTCEKIKPRCLCSIPLNTNVSFALKGDARTFGFVATDAASSPLPAGSPIPLSATQSRATIHAGTNTLIGTPFDPTQNQNPGIDGGLNQWAMITTTDDTNQIVVAPGDATQQRSSATPVLLQTSLLDFDSAETKGLSNKLFGHLTYHWNLDECEWEPFAGIGGFIEFAHHSDGKCAAPNFDQSCQTVAFSQWGIWFKAGWGFE